MQILDSVAQLAGNFSEPFHGLSASYSNFPWHTCHSIKTEMSVWQKVIVKWLNNTKVKDIHSTNFVKATMIEELSDQLLSIPGQGNSTSYLPSNAATEGK